MDATRPPQPRDGRGRTGLAVLLAFIAVVGSFYASNYVVQRSSAAIATMSESIVENAAPSIERMGRIRRAVLEVELALWEYIDEPSRRDEHAGALDGAVDEAKKSALDYFALPPYPGEQRPRMDLQESLLQFELAVADARALAESGKRDEALSSIDRKVDPARRRALDVAAMVIGANASRGRELAASIRETRERSVRLSTALNGVCGLFSAVVAWLLYRQSVARRALAEAHFAAIEQRAAELEQFAGRVAHDIRNPLAAARASAELASRRAPDNTSQELNRRIIRSLSRADAITTDLLAFARSGAKPDPGARTAPSAAIEEVVSDVRDDAERAGIEVRIEPTPPVAVACAPGVYLSLLGNLVRNSIKYMRDAPTRRITVRVLEEDDFVRTEVIDTGPGIAPSMVRSLFEPYFRAAPGSGAEGLGLGLATVKRLAEGHGGRVGVSSERGKGSTFWFTLPRAALDALVQRTGALEESSEPKNPNSVIDHAVSAT